MFIYCWYDGDFDAIKIGIGDDPAARMLDYTTTYDMKGTDLRHIVVPDGIPARSIEQQLHMLVVERGCIKLTIRSKSGQAASEVFRLKNTTYDAMASLILSEADRIGRSIVDAAAAHYRSQPRLAKDEAGRWLNNHDNTSDGVRVFVENAMRKARAMNPFDRGNYIAELRRMDTHESRAAVREIANDPSYSPVRY